MDAVDLPNEASGLIWVQDEFRVQIKKIVWLVFIGCCTSTLTSKWAFSVERKKELAFKAAKGKVDHFQCIQSKRKPYVSMKRSFQKLISFEPNMISKKYSASQVLLFSHWWHTFYFEKKSFFSEGGGYPLRFMALWYPNLHLPIMLILLWKWWAVPGN